jgi:hypothetical protein
MGTEIYAVHDDPSVNCFRNGLGLNEEVQYGYMLVGCIELHFVICT